MELCSYDNDDNILSDEFAEDEIAQACKILKSGKAPGWDKITSEHIKYGGQRLVIFFVITINEYIPLHFKRGLIVAIPKGDKNQLYQDNYRGITLISVIAKLYEKCTMHRVMLWNKDCKVIDELQGALQDNCSSLHTAWLTKETISYNVENGKPVYVGLLDIEKAYDTVWQEGLFYKLFSVGINGRTWRILRKFYNGFKCQVKVDGMLSEEIETYQGIHQGAPCSLFLHGLFSNEFLKSLKKSVVGAKLCKKSTCCPAFADDVTMITLSKEGLQILFNIAFEYSCKWRFKYSPKKCKVVIYGKDSNPGLNIVLGNNIIEYSNCENHLGLALATNEKDEELYIEKRIQSCKSVMYGIKAIGSKIVPITPTIGAKLYMDVCLPKLLYGCEIMTLYDKSITRIDKFHVHAAKNLQGLPDQASNCGSLSTMGWLSVECLIDIQRLMFLWRILTLPMSNIYKILMLRRITEIIHNDCKNYLGPTSTMLSLCKKYSIFKLVKHCVNTGIYVEMPLWKKLVKCKVHELYIKKWKANCALNKSLTYVNINVSHIYMSPWWEYTHRDLTRLHDTRLVVQLLLGRDRQNNGVCKLCLFSTASIAHILFECPSIGNQRNKQWLNVEKHATFMYTFLSDFSKLSNIEKCSMLLNAFNVMYVPEWKELYDAIIEFTCSLYRTYNALLEN